MQERNNCCLGKILKLIQKLQCACECEQIDNTCSKPFLGTPVNVECYNTRPITFYGCNNNLIEINYTATINGETQEGKTSIFRVEKVEGCCVLVCLLLANPDNSEGAREYITLRQSATINLDCVCAIKCLGDTIVDL